MPFPAAVAAVLKAKGVVGMTLAVTGTATYTNSTGTHVQAFTFTGGNGAQITQPGSVGCFSLGGTPNADLTIGYVGSGWRCPKYPYPVAAG